MQSLFKQKLLSLRNAPPATTFAEALLGDGSWLKKRGEAVRPKPELKKEVYSERVQMIESLERFTQEKTEELGTKILKIDGGEIHLKPEPTWDGLAHFKDLSSLKSTLKLDSKILETIFSSKSPSKIKILFVSEKFRNWDEISKELKGQFVDELLCGFPLKTAELFERMIGAMKLQQNEVIVYPVEGNDEADFAQDVMEVAAYFKPHIIVTLGAKATQKILKSSDRLTMVHGQFFSRKVGPELNFTVVPLFHPSIIESNPGMKKTTWLDMQKIMDHFKKLS